MPNRLLFSVITLLALSLLTAAAAHAQVVINEVGPASDPEWVELYRLGEAEALLDGCTLFMDDNHDIQKIAFNSSDTIPVENRFKVVKKGEYSWTTNWLYNVGDEITLQCPTSSDTLAYGNQAGAVVGAPASGQTLGRTPDGSGSVVILAESSEGGPNSGPLPTPTPTPAPTLTPTPTPTPKPTPAPTPTPTPTPKPTPTVIQTKPAQITPVTSPPILGIQQDDSQPPENLGEDEAGVSPEGPDSLAEGQEKPVTSRRWAYTAPLVITVTGVALLGISASPLIKKKLRNWKIEAPRAKSPRNLDEK